MAATGTREKEREREREYEWDWEWGREWDRKRLDETRRRGRAVVVGSGEEGKEELRHDVDARDKGTMGKKKQRQPASVYYFPG